MQDKNIFVGTSGYNYGSWKNTFYPEKLPSKQWLTYFSEQFQTVEINATFYRSFKKTTYESWYTRTSENFIFTIKGPKTITHLKRLNNIEEDLKYFLETSDGLKEKLKVMLWQFPASFKFTDATMEKLENFLKLLPQNKKHVFELRDTSWFTKQVFQLLNKYNAGFVINSTHSFAVQEMITGNIAYIRFHGPEALYASSYSDKELEEWAEKIKEFSKKSEVYCYFNNDINGYAIGNARTLIEKLKE